VSVRTYTVSQLARVAGVTVRTLHHYHHMGLLEPAGRTEAGYRLYGERELLRLQQILLFRELDLPLSEVRSILDEPDFDPIEALENHRRVLQARVERLGRLLTTIDKTIRKLTEGDMGMTDEELYEGLPKEQIERYQREAREMYDPMLVRESERRVRKMSKAQWQALKAEGDEVTRALAERMDRELSDAEVQQLIARHHAWIEHFYPCSAEVYRGLGQLYVQHDEFRAFYDQYRPGLADFLAKAMAYYADEVLADQDQ
jgi:DNA-binding transcriptional MerR regulator